MEIVIPIVVVVFLVAGFSVKMKDSFGCDNCGNAGYVSSSLFKVLGSSKFSCHKCGGKLRSLKTVIKKCNNAGVLFSLWKSYIHMVRADDDKISPDYYDYIGLFWDAFLRIGCDEESYKDESFAFLIDVVSNNYYHLFAPNISNKRLRESLTNNINSSVMLGFICKLIIVKLFSNYDSDSKSIESIFIGDSVSVRVVDMVDHILYRNEDIDIDDMVYISLFVRFTVEDNDIVGRLFGDNVMVLALLFSADPGDYFNNMVFNRIDNYKELLLSRGSNRGAGVFSSILVGKDESVIGDLWDSLSDPEAKHIVANLPNCPVWVKDMHSLVYE